MNAVHAICHYIGNKLERQRLFSTQELAQAALEQIHKNQLDWIPTKLRGTIRKDVNDLNPGIVERVSNDKESWEYTILKVEA